MASNPTAESQEEAINLIAYGTPAFDDAQVNIARTLDALKARITALENAATNLMDPVETAGIRCLAQDGPVGDDLGMVVEDRDLRRKFDKAFQRLRKVVINE